MENLVPFLKKKKSYRYLYVNRKKKSRTYMLQKYQVLTTNAMCHPGWDAKQKGKAVAGAITKSQVGSMDEIVLISTVYQCLFPYFK